MNKQKCVVCKKMMSNSLHTTMMSYPIGVDGFIELEKPCHLRCEKNKK